MNASSMNPSMTAFDVSLSAYTGNPQVSSFILHMKGGLINKTCSLSRHSSPLTCHFTDLMSGYQYTIRAIACLPEPFGCSETAKLTAWTIPSRKCFTTSKECGSFESLPFRKVTYFLYFSTINCCTGNLPIVCHD